MRESSARNGLRSIPLLLPLMFGLFIFKIWPCVQIILISFRLDYDYVSGQYNGSSTVNYQTIFRDPYFIQAILNTLQYVLAVVLGTLVLSMMISWSLFRIRKFVSVYRMAFFLPLISSDIAIGISWRLIFNRSGILNALLNAISLPSVGWLSDKRYSLLILVFYGIWSSLPITVFLLYTALQRIDPNLLISAHLDRASEGKLYFRIVFPMIRSTVLLSGVINCISAWLVVNGLFPLFSGLPGPYYNLYTMVYYIYYKFGEGNRALGEACAASVILLLLVSAFLIVRCLYGNGTQKKR